jgi:phosphoenolpyruvate---glycerone phosphotransferase subunit DhaL
MDDHESITAVDIAAAITRISQAIAENERYLNELDAVVGDGEHGFNLNRAFGRVRDRLAQGYPEAPDELLRLIGQELIASGGGAGTTFFAIAFLTASKLARGATAIDVHLLDEMATAALAEIKRRGGANRGDKTMIDALEPAVEALHAAIAGGSGSGHAMAAATAAAQAGAEATRTMLGKRGRGLYAGERALGTPDPGATSAFLIVRAMADWQAPAPQ